LEFEGTQGERKISQAFGADLDGDMLMEKSVCEGVP
jgi:hypothetical protein